MRGITTTDFGDLLARARRIVDAVLLALPDVLLGVIVLAAFVAAAWGLGRLVAAVLHRSGQPRGVQLVFGRIVRGAVVTIGVAVALTIVFPTLNAAPLFGALGVTSVAIGFVFKDVFQNLLAGLLILLTRPFRIGDQIVTGEHEGTVDDIQVRATLLRTYDNRRVVIPNSELYTNRVVVNTAHDRRRLSVGVGVGVDEDLDDVERRIVTVIGGLDGVLADPAPVVLVSALGDFSTLLDVRSWIAPTVRREAVEVTDAALAAIEADLDAAGVDLPYPCSGCSWSGSRRGDPQPAR